MFTELYELFVGHMAYFIVTSINGWATPIAQEIIKYVKSVAFVTYLWQWTKWLARRGSLLPNWILWGSQAEPGHDRGDSESVRQLQFGRFLLALNRLWRNNFFHPPIMRTTYFHHGFAACYGQSFHKF